MQFSKDIVKKVRCGQPIEAYGLTLYPIMMEDYTDFLLCKDAFAIMQGSLPARYLGMDFVSALFVYSMDEAANGVPSEQRTSLFQRMISLVYLTLRSTKEEIEQIAKDIEYKQFDENTVGISKIVIHQDGKTVEITPAQFSFSIRPLIAFQNGFELPDESDNPELIRLAQKMHANDATVNLKVDPDDLIASVAFQSRVSVGEVMKWTVREFEYRVRAIERDKHFTMFGQAELSGMISFKDGNPYPSWQYDTERDALGASPLSELGKKLEGAGVRQK